MKVHVAGLDLVFEVGDVVGNLEIVEAATSGAVAWFPTQVNGN